MPNYIQPYQQQMFNQPIIQQNNGFINVRNEMEARNYPVAPGNSIVFKDENTPNRVYVKTMGFSQLDRPTFERYKLIKDEVEDVQLPQQAEPVNKEFEDLKMRVDELRGEIIELKSKMDQSTSSNRRKKDGDD